MSLATIANASVSTNPMRNESRGVVRVARDEPRVSDLPEPSVRWCKHPDAVSEGLLEPEVTDRERRSAWEVLRAMFLPCHKDRVLPC